MVSVLPGAKLLFLNRSDSYRNLRQVFCQCQLAKLVSRRFSQINADQEFSRECTRKYANHFCFSTITKLIVVSVYRSKLLFLNRSDFVSPVSCFHPERSEGSLLSPDLIFSKKPSRSIFQSSMETIAFPHPRARVSIRQLATRGFGIFRKTAGRLLNCYSSSCDAYDQFSSQRPSRNAPFSCASRS